MPTPRIRTCAGKINNMEYTSFPSPDLDPTFRKTFTPGIRSIRRIIPFERPPIMSDVVLPRVPTLRSTGTGTGAQTATRLTFQTSTSPTSTSIFSKTPSKRVYTLTTHLIPSAYPRTPIPSGSEPIDTTQYEAIVNEGVKTVREGLTVSYMDVLKDWSNEVNDLGNDGGGGSVGYKEGGYRKVCEETGRVLWNCVNRVVRFKEDEDDGRDEGREKVTLFVTHANGFPKETYEPAIQSLLTQFDETYSQTSSPLVPPIIDEIWLFEAIQHGDTGLINTGLLPRAFDWLDNVRDILHFLLYYIPDRVDRDARGEAVDLPTHLIRLPDEIVSRRIKEGFSCSGRKIVGIGHSLGGCSVARAAIEYPALFSSVILVDPVIRPLPSNEHEFKFGILPDAALRRRGVWRSREEAHASFLKSPFFKAWHPDALNAYVKYAITEDKDTGVAKLKMSGLHETIVFLHTRTSFETRQMLTELDSRIPLFWIVSGLEMTVLGDADMAQETVWRRSVNSSNVVLPVGHLIPHEAPVEFASLVREFLIKKYSVHGTVVGSDGVVAVDSPEVQNTAFALGVSVDKDESVGVGDLSLRAGSGSGTRLITSDSSSEFNTMSRL